MQLPSGATGFTAPVQTGTVPLSSLGLLLLLSSALVSTAISAGSGGGGEVQLGFGSGAGAESGGRVGRESSTRECTSASRIASSTILWMLII